MFMSYVNIHIVIVHYSLSKISLGGQGSHRLEKCLKLKRFLEKLKSAS